MTNECWFEIGVTDVNGETHTIFNSKLLSECVKYFKELNKENYFIDIWEYESDGTPVPIGNVDLNSLNLR